MLHSHSFCAGQEQGSPAFLAGSPPASMPGYAVCADQAGAIGAFFNRRTQARCESRASPWSATLCALP